MPMSTTTQQDPAELLIQVVTDATTLSDEQKDLYLGELFEGRIHPDLERDLPALCDREAAVAGQEMQEIQSAIDTQEHLGAKEEQEVLEFAQPLAKEHEEETKAIVTNYNQECSAIDRGLDKGVEGDVRGNEETEADAIRKMLKGKSA